MLNGMTPGVWIARCDSCEAEQVEIRGTELRDAYESLAWCGWSWCRVDKVDVTNVKLILCPLCRRVATVQKACDQVLAAQQDPQGPWLQAAARAAAQTLLPGLQRGDQLP